MTEEEKKKARERRLEECKWCSLTPLREAKTGGRSL
jgi:hypothetical protein